LDPYLFQSLLTGIGSVRISCAFFNYRLVLNR